MPAFIGRETSRCEYDPYRAIAAACILQAVRDMKLYRKNPKRALEASVFLVTEGEEFANMGGLAVSERSWEGCLVKIF